jgi:hypothetical protein
VLKGEEDADGGGVLQGEGLLKRGYGTTANKRNAERGEEERVLKREGDAERGESAEEGK